MEIKKIIFVVVVLITFCLGKPVRPADSPLAPEPIVQQNECFGTTQIKQNWIAETKNEQIAAKSQTRTSTDKTEGTSDSRPESMEKNSQDSKENESTPLKPFVPSEKIPAEQAVDFPVDI